MPPTGDRSPPSLSSPLSGRRMLSRLTSPFSAKSRSIGGFHIDVEDPHRQYSPGDIVKGSVRLRVLKPSRVTHIVVSLHGYVQVFKNPGSPGEGFRANTAYVGTRRGKSSGEYFGNGFASLFEDEVVLCGDGRLADGSYQFNFELQFPDKDLPSSIDFERGTITYMISATMTRPTTISPTMTCDQKVYLVEKIDISPIYPPKPRTIMLEPLAKRSRAKHSARKHVDGSDHRSSRRTDSSALSDGDRGSILTSVRGETDTPLSPVLSEVSFDSRSGSGRRTSQPDSTRISPGGSGSGGSEGSKGTISKSSINSKTITATVEPLHGGCLRGDTVNIKVNVDHTKPIKSINGVIVTLYRQARVDMHPAIPLGPMEKGTERKYEDYYPKSLTGLGGLSLSGAGSSHLFRKDLTQSMVPLYIDPNNLNAEVIAKVRVPDEAFPTISCVPGAMISFKYFAEVIVDIQGRLGSQDRNVGGLNLGNARPQMSISETGEPIPAPFGSTLIDTAPIRRDKGVITCTFEIIVGTQDSVRRKGKRRITSPLEAEPTQAQHQPPQFARAQSYQAATTPGVQPADGEQYWYDPSYGHPAWNDQYPHGYDAAAWNGDYDPAWDYERYHAPPPAVPIPQMPDESQMSEKDRIRQAEARLLPSEPPGVAASAVDSAVEGATAPDLSEGVSSTWSPPPGVASASTAPWPAEASTTNGRHSDHPPGSSAPAYETVHPGPSTIPPADLKEPPTEQLHSQASAPPLDNTEETGDSAEEEATAPTLEDIEATPTNSTFDSHADAAGSSELPRYER